MLTIMFLCAPLALAGGGRGKRDRAVEESEPVVVTIDVQERVDEIVDTLGDDESFDDTDVIMVEGAISDTMLVAVLRGVPRAIDHCREQNLISSTWPYTYTKTRPELPYMTLVWEHELVSYDGGTVPTLSVEAIVPPFTDDALVTCIKEWAKETWEPGIMGEDAAWRIAYDYHDEDYASTLEGRIDRLEAQLEDAQAEDISELRGNFLEAYRRAKQCEEEKEALERRVEAQER